MNIQTIVSSLANRKIDKNIINCFIYIFIHKHSLVYPFPPSFKRVEWTERLEECFLPKNCFANGNFLKTAVIVYEIGLIEDVELQFIHEDCSSSESSYVKYSGSFVSATDMQVSFMLDVKSPSGRGYTSFISIFVLWDLLEPFIALAVLCVRLAVAVAPVVNVILERAMK